MGEEEPPPGVVWVPVSLGELVVQPVVPAPDVDGVLAGDGETGGEEQPEGQPEIEIRSDKTEHIALLRGRS